jgi:dolichyl-phosphate beta-glucosyltransferase
MDLSIVLPVYNSKAYIAQSATTLYSYLVSRVGLSFELIFVDDGSADETADTIFALNLPNTTVIRLPCNQGKFGALAAGMAATKGRCCIFTDGDLPYEVEAISYMANTILQRGFHVVIGDRTLLGSEYAERLSFVRSLGTRAFTLFVRVLVAGGLFDTQCGIKGFRGDVARELFPLIRDRGFSGDVELLYIALKYNLEIKRIPVRLRRQAPSSVSVIRHGLMMLRRISKLRRSWRRGDYDSEGLREIADQSYWLEGFDSECDGRVGSNQQRVCDWDEFTW